MMKKILKGILILVLLVIFGVMSMRIHPPFAFLSLMILSIIWLCYTKRIKLIYGFISLIAVLFVVGGYFWCPADRPWNEGGTCYSCLNELDFDIEYNEAEQHKKVCPNRFLTEQYCCGDNKFYTSSLREPKGIFNTLFCDCSYQLANMILFEYVWLYSFYLFIWVLILKLVGFLDKRKSK